MKNYERKDILPVLKRAGMYAGDQGSRTTEEWYADAVAAVLNASQELELRKAVTDADEATTITLPGVSHRQ